MVIVRGFIKSYLYNSKQLQLNQKEPPPFFLRKKNLPAILSQDGRMDIAW